MRLTSSQLLMAPRAFTAARLEETFQVSLLFSNKYRQEPVLFIGNVHT